MSRRWSDFNHPKPQPFGLTTWLPIVVLLALGALAFVLIFVGFLTTRARAECSASMMRALAQEHSDDQARRDTMDHRGFDSRAHRGARAENVAMGVSTKEKAIAMWWRSPHHATNMRLPGCRGIASAISRSGKRYWTIDIGD
jgi:hypothetical protein